MLLIVPPLEEKPWPTLGPYVCDWIEEYLVHGPGDLLGKPIEFDEQKRLLIYRTYEIYPEGHPRAGRRRFKRCCWSLRKGMAKTEDAALIAIAELYPDAPVRCSGFGRRRKILTAGVTDPYIPMLAYSEGQSDDLAFTALRKILENSKVARDFDIGLGRVMRATGDGKVEAVSSAPDSRDGARTTFQVADETHRFVRNSRPKTAHKTMLENIPKRRGADAWTLEITTAPAPGEGSVAEAAHTYAKNVAEGRASDPSFFFFHRQASEGADFTTREGVRAGLHEATGPSTWAGDFDAIVDSFFGHDADIPYLRRVWFNQLVKSGGKAFDLAVWKALAREREVPKGAAIALGFDGARSEDAAALIGTEIETGYQFNLGIWEKPSGPVGDEWEVDENDVDAAVHAAFEHFNVVLFYADPPYWESTVASWAGEFGKEKVVAWPTYRWFRMAHAVRAFRNAITDGSLSHDGSKDYARHIGNAHKRLVSARDDKGAQMFILQKERDGSPDKIDAAPAGVLSWQARLDAIARGDAQAPRPSVYEARGLVTV